MNISSMKKRHSICMLLLALLCFASQPLISQTISPSDLLKRDYPALAKEYEDMIKKQNASYIFAIDFSTSMKSLEPVVKSNVATFIQSLPNGDRFTIIREGSTENTDFVYLQNTPISDDSKQSIINNLNSTPFSEQASDGYKLAEKIIEAANQTGTSDLIYIFIFTDFEYYTKENGYDKNKCNWNKLRTQYAGAIKGKKVVKVGLELSASNLRSNAIFKSDLDTVFGGVQYYRIVDGNSLSNWFNDTRANILRDRLNLIISRETAKEVKALSFNLKVAKGEDPICSINGNNKLISGFKVLNAEKFKTVPTPIFENPFKASYTDSAEIELVFNQTYNHEKGYNEVDKLLIEPYVVTVPVSVGQPEALISWWITLIIICVLLAFLICLFLTCRKPKKFKSIRVYAECKGKINATSSNTFSNVKGVIISATNPARGGMGHFGLDKLSKQLEVSIYRNCPCKIWKKSGVYVSSIKGNGIKYEIKSLRTNGVLMTGSRKYICSGRQFYGVVFTFEDEGTTYEITAR